MTLLIIEQYVHRALQFADSASSCDRGEVAWHGEAGGMGDDLLRHYLGEAMTTASWNHVCPEVQSTADQSTTRKRDHVPTQQESTSQPV